MCQLVRERKALHRGDRLEAPGFSRGRIHVSNDADTPTGKVRPDPGLFDFCDKDEP